MTYSFLEFSSSLVNFVYFTPHQRYIACEYRLQRKSIMKQQQTFSLVPDIDVEKSCFLM